MEYDELIKLIAEDNVDELANILNSNENHIHFNNLHSSKQTPLLHVAVREQSQKVLEYLLSQHFVNKNICNSRNENIYHVVCGIRGAEQLFSIIERNVPHHLLLKKSHQGMILFHYVCAQNNIFFVKRVHEIMESLNVDLTYITQYAILFALQNKVIDMEFINYVSSLDKTQSNNYIFAIRASKFDIVVYLMNVYLRHSIPSHLHNQFHIFHFSNLPLYNKTNINNNNNNNNNNSNIIINESCDNNNKIDNNLNINLTQII